MPAHATIRAWGDADPAAADRRVLAAIDASRCAAEVLQTAQSVAELTDANVLALHVRENSSGDAARYAQRFGVQLRETDGEPIEAIAAAAGDPAVVAVVLGARGAHRGPRPAGHTALELITRVRKPLVVVPPNGIARAPIARILNTAGGNETEL